MKFKSGLRASSGVPPKIFEKFCTNRSFVRLLVRSKIFQNLVRADAIDLVQKSSNFEPSSRFFSLKISTRRRNEAFEFDSSCRAPQRALQLESNSNATVQSLITIIQIQASGVPPKISKNFRKNFVQIVRLFVCSFVRIFFKIQFAPTRSIWSKNCQISSHPRDFSAV